MRDPALELAYAASDAYRYEAENLAVIDGVLDTLSAPRSARSSSGTCGRSCTWC
jgi:hypothetical protein